jgi:hypothetical protein
MKPHKWAKEIKAWADGAEIEGRNVYEHGYGDWHILYDPTFSSNGVEYRIKPEPDYDYINIAKEHYANLRKYEKKRWEQVCVEVMNDFIDGIKPQPKEPQYLSAEPRLVSYAPDGSTCTLNIEGEEVYFNREQTAQEPMAWMNDEGFGLYPTNDTAIPLYTHPHQWQGLTDDEMYEEILKASIPQYQEMDVTATNLKELIRAIEQALKKKNHVS